VLVRRRQCPSRVRVKNEGEFCDRKDELWGEKVADDKKRRKVIRKLQNGGSEVKDCGSRERLKIKGKGLR